MESTHQISVALYHIFKCQTLNGQLTTHLYKSVICPIVLYGTPVSNIIDLQIIQI
jgi:hypothetical protein